MIRNTTGVVGTTVTAIRLVISDGSRHDSI